MRDNIDPAETGNGGAPSPEKIDLSKCKPGDRFETEGGLIVTFEGPNTNDYMETHPYMFSDGFSRNVSGFATWLPRMEDLKRKLEDDND